MLRLNWCKTITTQEVEQAKAQQSVVINHLNTLFEEIDVLIIPTTPGVAPHVMPMKQRWQMIETLCSHSRR